MAHISFPADSHTVDLPSGVTYSYTYIPASPASNPTILLLHGFPSSSHDWHLQIPFLRSAGYGVLAPDLLGYGQTSSPSDPASYTGKIMSAQIVELLDHLGIKKVHVVAHDWGCGLLAKLSNWFPERVLSAVYLAVAYNPPGSGIDLDAINGFTKQVLGYEVLGYWRFFEKQEAGAIIEENFESFHSLVYAANPEVWKTHLSPLGAIEAWLKAGKTTQIATWAPDLPTYKRIIGPNISPALNWYRAAIADLNKADEAAAELDPRLHMPVLYIQPQRDPLTGGEKSIQDMKALVDDFKAEKVNAGHWLQLEEAERVNKLLVEFVGGVEEKIAKEKGEL